MSTKLDQLRAKVMQIQVNKRYDRMFLLDTSYSMLGEKLFTAKNVLDEYIKNGDGLIVFGSDVFHIDYSKLNTLMASGETAILPAIMEALKFYPKELILITDGEANRGGYAPEIINFVSRISGIIIHTIAIGECADKPLLETIAELTGGKFNYSDQIHHLKDTIKMLCAPETSIAL